MLPERTQARKDAVKNAPCAGCGAETSPDLSLCSVCGKRADEGFQPLDNIRSSYNLQGRTLPSANAPKTETLFYRERNAISDTAWACTVYSMVPYLGILFVPVALAIGGFGYLTARKVPHGGGRTALTSVGVSLVLLVIQLIFWWLLYLIPEIGI